MLILEPEMAYQFFHIKLLILYSYFVICKNCIITVVWVFLNVKLFFCWTKIPKVLNDRKKFL